MIRLNYMCNCGKPHTIDAYKNFLATFYIKFWLTEYETVLKAIKCIKSELKKC